MFELEAKLVDHLRCIHGVEFKFHSDVLIDYSTAFVVSERRGKVEVEAHATPISIS